MFIVAMTCFLLGSASSIFYLRHEEPWYLVVLIGLYAGGLSSDVALRIYFGVGDFMFRRFFKP